MSANYEGSDPGTGNGRIEYDPAAYGDDLAGDYDELYPSDGLDTRTQVDFLADLASRHPDGSVLEFGIGTGRLALQMRRRGVTVAGIEASERMVMELRRKSPEARIDVAIGDYANTSIGRRYSVVAIVLNNIFDPRGLPAQLSIFRNAARHLALNGLFVIDAFVLHDKDRDGSWTIMPRYVGEDHAEVQLARFDIETSTLERTLVHLLPQGARFVSVRDRYASPEELDVMAHVCGMERVERYSSWARAPFTASSARHISVYRLLPSDQDRPR